MFCVNHLTVIFFTESLKTLYNRKSLALFFSVIGFVYGKEKPQCELNQSKISESQLQHTPHGRSHVNVYNGDVYDVV